MKTATRDAYETLLSIEARLRTEASSIAKPEILGLHSRAAVLAHDLALSGEGPSEARLALRSAEHYLRAWRPVIAAEIAARAIQMGDPSTREAAQEGLRSLESFQRKGLASQPDLASHDKLRRAQRQALEALLNHFQESAEAAIVQLPVGCGKTGVMALAPSVLGVRRSLVLAPNLEIRENLSRQLDPSLRGSFWARLGLGSAAAPVVCTLDDESAILDCDSAQLVVANIQQLVAQDGATWLEQMATDYFDLILVDEGHHNAAESWDRVLRAFPRARVVSLTATPLRADGRRVVGKLVHSTRLQEAIRDGAVKDLANWRLEPAELHFRLAEQENLASLEEVLELRDEDWFSRGLALAPECNRHIVDASLRCLEALRSRGCSRHKIIAAACSIDHARSIASLYRERGVRATTMHSYLPAEALRTIRSQIRRDELDVVVQVQMLGEGADYPSFSVAAIFRPFRHLVPYLQFIGRITRVLVEGAAGHPDNRAYVVSHPGLNVDRWWDALREFDEPSQPDFLGRETAGKNFQVSDEKLPEALFIGAFQPELQVISEQGGRIVEQSLLCPPSSGLVLELEEVLERHGLSWDVLGLEANSRLRRLEAPPLEWETRPVSPQRQRQEARRRLNERVRSAAPRLLHRLGLSATGPELESAAPNRPKANNLAAAIIVLNREVKARLGVASGTRAALPSEALQSVHDAMDAIVETAFGKLQSFLVLRGSG